MKPDNRKTTYTMLKTESRTAPKVVFGTTALKWIRALVDGHSTEVGFYAVVDTREDGSYFIRDVFYPKHSEMNGGTCEISPEGETEMITWLLDHGREADISKVRFWGHSHSGMCSTSPSGQDETQALERMTQNQAYLIRGITCKDGELSVSFFDFENQVRFDNIKWAVEDDTDESIVVEKLAQIQAILGDAEKSPPDKLFEIAKTAMTDEETEAITAKVNKLKKENEPPKSSVVTVHRGGQTTLFPSQQPASFHGRQDGRDPRFWPDDEGDEHFVGAASNTPSSIYNEEEVDAMIKEWEETQAQAPAGV